MANASLPCISSCVSHAVVDIMSKKRLISYLYYYIYTNLLACKLLVINEMAIDNLAIFFVIAIVYICLCNRRALLTLHINVVRAFSGSSQNTEVRADFIGAHTTVQAGSRLVCMLTVCLLLLAQTIQLRMYGTLLVAAVSRDTAFSI